MHIKVNGICHSIKSHTIGALLIEFNYADAVVATALNGRFIPQTLRYDTEITDGDQIEIVAPKQGG